jgi:hypothetical protein
MDSGNTNTAIAQTDFAIADAQARHVAFYLTIIFAYISVAYTAGSKLSRLQLLLTTFLFVAASIRQIFGMVTHAQVIPVKNSQLIEITGRAATDLGMVHSPWRPAAIWSTGVLAALLLMWIVRHPKTT